MRIGRIELRAFGSFTGEVLDFSPAAPDACVIYGPNGAGKSTLLRAVTDLLFGIPNATRDDFLHPAPRLRIAGRIESGSESLEFCWRKGNRDTFLRPDGITPADAAPLLKLLGGLDRAAFESRYGLSTASLRSGGDAMTGAGAGEILVQAAGLIPARKLLADLKADMDAIFKPRAINPTLNAALSMYDQERRSLKDIVIPKQKLTELRQELDAAENAKRDADNAAEDAKQELERLRRILDNLPDLVLLAEHEAALARLAAVPDLPADAREKRVRAEDKLTRAVSDLEQVARERVAVETAIAQLRIEPHLLESKGAIEALMPGLGEYRKGLADLPRLEREAADARAAAEALWNILGLERPLQEAGRYRFDSARIRTLRESAAKGKQLELDLKTAISRIEKAEVDRQDAEAALRRVPTPAGSQPLQAAVSHSTDLALESRLTVAEQTATQAETEWQILARALLPVVSIDDLAAMSVALPETRQRLAQRWKETKKAADEADIKSKSAALRQRAAEAKYAHPDGVAEEASLARLAAARRGRDTVWAKIAAVWRNEMTREQAQAGESEPLDLHYEREVQGADGVADRRFSFAAQVAAREEQKRAAEEARDEATVFNDGWAAARDAHAKAMQDWRDAWPQAPPGLPLPPEEMEAWLRQRETILHGVRQAEERRREAQSLASEISTHALQIAARLTEAGAEARAAGETLGVLLRRAQSHLEALQRAAAQRASLEDKFQSAVAVVQRESAEVEKTRVAQSAWQSVWVAMIAAARFPISWAPNQVSAVLDDLTSVLRKLDDAQGFEQRTAGLRRDQERFVSQVAELVARVAPGLAAIIPEAAAEQLQSRLKASERDVARSEDLRRQQDEKAARQGTSEIDQADALAELAQYCQQAGCSEPRQLPAIESQVEQKRTCVLAVQQLKRSLAERNGVPLERVRAEAAGHAVDALRTQLQALKSDAEDARQRSEVALCRHTTADDEIRRLGHSQTSALGQQRMAEHLAGIKRLGEEFARLHLAQEIAIAAVESFRKQHQAPILELAGPIFQRLTLDEYEGLESGFDAGDRPVLYAARNDGKRHLPGELSDGTRDQLFLALRLAATAMAPPLPLILDDIFMTFDDPRAQAGLGEIARLAAHTQVLLFTHHRRIAECASAVPIRVLELPSRPAALGVGAGQ